MRIFFVSAVLLVVGVPAAAVAQQPEPFASDRLATVMTQNLYHGVDAEFAAAIQAAGTPAFFAKVTLIYQGYFARNFPERAAVIAAEIDAKRPDLVGLQEVTLVRTQSPPDGPATAATNVELDFLQILLDALAARGLHYEAVVQAVGFDIEAPSTLGKDVRHTNRDVILARTDLPSSHLKLSNAQAGNFAVNCPILGGSVTLRRGWVSVDAKVRGKDFRFVSTHLDGDCLSVTPFFQVAQAGELLAVPAATTLPLVLVGDFNSPPAGAAYNVLAAGGLIDAWTTAAAGPGLTCCQDDDLLNASSVLDRRIDLVWLRGAWTALAISIVGDNPADKTAPSGMWPSDHAGVVALLALANP